MTRCLVVNAGNKLWSSGKHDRSSKATEIQKMSQNSTLNILPEPYDEELPFIRSPLMDIIPVGAYTKKTRGASHVIYARPSIGKTSACLAFMKLAVPKEKGVQALMITATNKNVPYITHMAKVLHVENEEDVLVDLVAGMRTVNPTPASVLILDEMNAPGVDNCNISLVDSLMRYIYQYHQGIHLIVVTHNAEVADVLCKLNAWQKIAPMSGLMNPTRNEICAQKEKTPSMQDPIPWNSCSLEWKLEQLTKFIDSRFQDNSFEKDDAGNISWLELGMTPTDAEQEAVRMLAKKAEEETEAQDTFPGTL
jgi:hypothetical protein